MQKYFSFQKSHFIEKGVNVAIFKARLLQERLFSSYLDIFKFVICRQSKVGGCFEVRSFANTLTFGDE